MSTASLSCFSPAPSRTHIWVQSSKAGKLGENLAIRHLGQGLLRDRGSEEMGRRENTKDLYSRVNTGRTKDSLLKVEEREPDAVLDENGEVLSFHHDRPVGGKWGFSSPEEGRQGAFLRNLSLEVPLERRHLIDRSWG